MLLFCLSCCILCQENCQIGYGFGEIKPRKFCLEGYHHNEQSW